MEQTGRRTSVRHRVLWLTVILYAITYTDRVTINTAMLKIAPEFNFDKETQGLIYSAFSLGYFLCQIPGGWLADKFGPRRVLAGIVVWWSAFTMLTARAWSLPSFLVIRFLFGCGEGGAFPGATRTFSRWLTTSERGFAQGITHSGSRISGAITPLLVGTIMIQAWGWNWRTPFMLFGAIGLVWAAIWYLWYRDRPEDHPAVSPAELEWINQGKAAKSKKSLPWKSVLGQANIWYLSIMYFCYGYVLWLFFNWLPTYFSEAHKLTIDKAGFYAMIPALAGAATNALGGWLSDYLHHRTGNLKFSRRVIAITGFLISVVFLPLCALATTANTAVLAMALAFGGLELTTGVSWAVPLDVGKDYSGTVSGIMNTLGNFGGFLSPIIVPLLVKRFDSWTPAFVLGSVLCLVAAILWFKIDPTRSVVPDATPEPEGRA